jgi:antirestriction protein ArdC
VAYVRTKVIKGHTYYYLVRSVRDGAKVRQVFVRYLGKTPGAHHIAPSGPRSLPEPRQNADRVPDGQPAPQSVPLYRTADSAAPDETRPQLAPHDASDSRRRARQVKGDKIKQLTERALHDLAAALQAGQSEAMAAYLQAMATFHTYSFGNQLLIAAQRPTARRVAGFRTWKKLGRSVRKGERGLLIYAPVRFKAGAKRTEEADEHAPSPAPDDPLEKEITGFRPVYVFDVAQTEGPPLPDAPRVQGDPGERLQQLEQFTAQRGIRLVYTEDLRPGVDGVSSGGLIRLRGGLPPAEAFGVLVHELAHEQLHHGDAASRPPKTVVETEAEAVAHVVSAAIGLDVGTASSDYIQLYQGSTDTLAASLHRIQRTASDILKGLLAEPE